MTSLTPGRVELESRLHELTESLIQKQTTLETLNSEKSTLNVQLQRLQVKNFLISFYFFQYLLTTLLFVGRAGASSQVKGQGSSHFNSGQCFGREQ